MPATAVILTGRPIARAMSIVGPAALPPASRAADRPRLTRAGRDYGRWVRPLSEAALRLIESEVSIDTAVLDVNLGYEKSFHVAKLLAGKAIPFLFAAGYNSAGIPKNGSVLRSSSSPCVSRRSSGCSARRLSAGIAQVAFRVFRMSTHVR